MPQRTEQEERNAGQEKRRVFSIKHNKDMAKDTITITLYKSELVYEVQNKTYLTGRSRQTGDNHEEVANMQANDDEENANQILRSLGNAFATLKTKLSEYLEESGTSANDAQMGGTGNLIVALKVPSNFNKATNDTLAAALHQYLVNTAIGDWFTITNKADAADYITLAAANLEQIREALNKRVRPTRATPTPAPSNSTSENSGNTGNP